MPRHKKNRSAEPKVAVQPVAVPPSSHALVGLLLILLTTYVVYWPAMHGGLVWDDDTNITRPALQSLRGLFRIWFDPTATAHSQYYPLVHTAFWLEHKLWGDSVLGYHLVTILWHSLNVVLVYLIASKLKIPGALLAAAIFALHPVMVESVAWMAEQKNTLSAVFYLGSMLAYLEFDSSRQRSSYLAALGLYALALMTKTAIVTLPAALLVVFWWQRGTLSWRRDLLPLLPFFALGAAAGLITIWVEWKFVGAQGTDFELTFPQRGLLAGRAVWFYLSKLVWPTRLTFIYPRWTIDPTQWWQWTFSLAAIATTVILWAVRRRARAPLAAWLFFCGTLVPVLGFLNVYLFMYSFVADHFQYLASLGVIVLVAATIARGLARLPEFQRRSGAALCLLLVGTLAVLSWRQAGIYADSITLYRSTIERNPDCWMAHTNLGLAESDMGNRQDALEHLRLALRIKPDSAEIHNGLATVLIQTGQAQEAIGEVRAALAAKPDFPLAYNNLGVALMRLGQFPEAIEPLQHAVQLSPDFATARANLGAALSRNGQIPQAIEQLSQALQSDPTQAEAQNNLGLLLAGTGQFNEATEHFLLAVYLQPDRAEFHNNLASAWKDAGSPQQAIEQYQVALRLQPDYLQACVNLSQALADVGRSEEAIATAQRALELATSANEAATVKQINEWLTNYRDVLQRPGHSATPRTE